MKNLLTTLLITASISAVAQTEPLTQPPCDEINVVLGALMIGYKEQPIWAGRTDKGMTYGIFANTKEKSWSLIQYNDKMACLILNGSESVVFPESKSLNRTNTASPE